MKKQYRQGPVGALLDEYERALNEYQHLLKSISNTDFIKVIDPITEDPDCRSVETITNHVVRAGYGYANYIRKQFNEPFIERRETYDVADSAKANLELDQMFAYTLYTMKNKYTLSFNEVISNIIETRWGQNYDFDQLLEHAIVHILRHRRQIEKLKQTA
jgi:uncharacterized damage-inducible protein DinB